MLGGLRLEQPDGTTTRCRPRKIAGLLAYLAYYRQRGHPREELIEVFWPEDDLATARHKLSVALSALRRELEPEGVPDSSVLVADRVTVALSPGAVSTDVEAFEAALRAAADDAGSEDDAARTRQPAAA